MKRSIQFIKKLPTLSSIIHKIQADEGYIFEFINECCKNTSESEPFIKALIPEENRIERLTKEAQMLIKKYNIKEERPILFGIPIGVKDLFLIDNFPTKCGSKLPEKLFEGPEAAIVSALKRLGVLIYGKTVTTEFAYKEPGPTRNPWNIDHSPGGSSSGSAAGVASGYVPIALGTQTVGSIIRPSSYCGVYGYKPTLDRISKDGVIPFSTSADTVGFIAQDIDGLEIIASLFCKLWDKNIKRKPSKEICIGAIKGNQIKKAEEELANHQENMIEKLKSSGVRVQEIELFEDIELIKKNHWCMVSSEFALVHEVFNNWQINHKEKYSNSARDFIEIGRKHSIADLVKAREERTKFRDKINKIKAKFGIDIWICPATTSDAPKFTKTGVRSTGKTIMNLPWSYLGLPVITIPFGFSLKNLPFGLQIAGEFSEDEYIFYWGKILEDLIKKLI